MDKAKSGSAKSSPTDAIALLTQDHKEVQKQFKDFEKLTEADGSDEEKAEIVQKVCGELTIHAQIEEEIFYPAVREALDEEDLLDEAEVEHATAKDLIAQLEDMEPGDALYDAKFTVLGEYINHHVKEEQDEMFPKVKKSKLDLQALGEELMQRKQELKAEMGLDDPQEETDGMPPISAKGSSKKQGSGARK